MPALEPPQLQIYYAYGSNMNTARLLERVPGAQPLGPARLEGWRLCCTKPGADGSGKANLIEDPKSTTWGVLYALGPDDWERLDAFEPGYARAEHPVLDESGTSWRAQLYLWTKTTPELPMLAGYRDQLLAGARGHGLPPDYVAMLEALPTL